MANLRNEFVAFVNNVEVDTQCLAWALLGIHEVHLEPDPLSLLAGALGALDAGDWNRVTPSRKQDFATGNTYQFFEAQMRGGFVPYGFKTILTLPSGSKVAVFGHLRAFLGDIAIMVHSTSDLVLRLQVTGSRSHISIMAELMSGTAAYHDTAQLTRMLTVASLKAKMEEHLRVVGQLGPFQRLVLLKLGRCTPLSGNIRVWNPAWMHARHTVTRRLHVKTTLVQRTLTDFW
jgi:hypothetical protein